MNKDVEAIIREYIDRSLHMSLATSVNDKPWVTELHFVYDNNLNLYWRSLPSRRHSQELLNNSNVSGNIVHQHTLDEYPHAIYFEGIGVEISDAEERRKVLPLFESRLASTKDILDEAEQQDGHKFYKVSVQKWYAFGKFGGDNGQKLELNWAGGTKYL